VNKTKNKYNSKHDNGDGGIGGDDGDNVIVHSFLRRAPRRKFIFNFTLLK